MGELELSVEYEVRDCFGGPTPEADCKVMIVDGRDVVTEGQQPIVRRESDLGGVAPISTVAGLGDRLVSGFVATADAFEQLAAAPSRQAAATGPDLVRRLISEVVPRLQAELDVLVPAFGRFQVPSDSIAELSMTRPQVGILAEQLSRIADNAAAADSHSAAYIKRMAERLADSLRRHVALELSLVRKYLEPNLGHMETDRLLLSLSAAEDSARNAIVFVVPPVYLPTEAHVLRQNPKTPKLVRLRDIEKS